MKVDSLFRVFQSYGDSAGASETQGQASAAASESSQTSEAVSVASDFGVGESDSAARTAKVAALKQQVADGSYKVDSQKVAEAFIREAAV